MKLPVISDAFILILGIQVTVTGSVAIGVIVAVICLSVVRMVISSIKTAVLWVFPVLV